MAKVKYLVGSPEELKEIEKAMGVFFERYVLEPKENTLTVQKTTERCLDISSPSLSPLETLYSSARLETPSLPAKVLTADFRENAHVLELMLGDWVYMVHFGKKSQ